MKIVGLLASLMFFVSSYGYSDVDPCTGPGVAHNSWFFEVNREDQASRDDLLRAIDLMGTGGFSVKNIFTYRSATVKTFVIGFRPGYWSDPDKAKQVKNETLAGLMAIPDSRISCNGIVRPAPALGGRN